MSTTGLSVADARRLAPSALYRACDPAGLPFETTADLEGADEPLGQARAVEAIGFAIGMQHRSYNLFAMGPEGLGRRTVVSRLLEQAARARSAPPDWCYVFNFRTPHRPSRLTLPTGRAPGLQRDMARLLPAQVTGKPFLVAAPTQAILDSWPQEAQKFGLTHLLDHIAFTTYRSLSKLLASGHYHKLYLDECHALKDSHEPGLKAHAARKKSILGLTGTPPAQPNRLQQELESVIEKLPRWRREVQRKLRELNRQITQGVVGSLIAEMRSAYADLPQVLEHLSAVQDDVLDHAEFFQQPKEGEGVGPLALMLGHAEPVQALMARYAVNVLVHHDGAQGAPVVFEDHPTHDNLVGRIEHESRMGALVTDFTLIKGGALHRANGGYLVVDAIKLLTQPLAWEALKRALRSREIRTEPLAQALSLISTVSLEPEPIPLDVKVIVVGQRVIYHLLHALDPEFSELFKVVADFDEDMRREEGSDLRYARLIATLARENAVRPIERAAVARLIEHASRGAGDAQRLSLSVARLADLMLEANHLADTQGNGVMTRAHVQGAIDGQTRRSARISDRLREETLRGRLLIDTAGERTGQVNGLSVFQLGDHAFGSPARITATVRLGAGGVVDIERETRLGGPIHAKGVLILGGYLAGHYLPDRLLSLTASLVFEQSYGGVEGDSASSAELYALLSAIARVPLRQSLAVTGSVNQHGDVQAVGGVNEKVEGFFRLCRDRGLTGDQGVIIPVANRDSLMLDHAVVEAVGQGRFHLYAVDRIDQGLELLTGWPAGRREAGGRFAPDTLNGRIEARLSHLAERARAAPGPEAGARGQRGRAGR
ncbi:MAG: AAA family ATPase [Burkholderiales bacterium]|nr:AAA family ATPase [Burkholderiales bacterium]